MKPRILPPPDADLNRTSLQIAMEYGISPSVAYRWKKEAGIQMKRGYTGIRRSSPGLLVTREEWTFGCHHVAKLLGVSPQAAWILRNRLIAEGHDIPKLKRGAGRRLVEQPSEASESAEIS